MASDDTLHRCVTEFMLDTCRYTKADYSLHACIFRSGLTAGANDMCELFPSGSSAEFYIKPMLRCIGDIDVMMYDMSCIAIPAGHKPPTELPAYFKRNMPTIVYKIVDSDQPGFVYLKPWCILANGDKGGSVVEMGENNWYGPEFLPNPNNQSATSMLTYESMQSAFGNVIRQNDQSISRQLNLCAAAPHGPALQTEFLRHLTDGRIVKDLNCYVHDIDYVRCMRCPLWPPAAESWPMRSRIHGVPNTTTIATVVNNGCDVVGAVHPSCRQNEWVNTHQWRLSFSRAEVTLINNWTPVQQIIYHMLRFVIKREVLSKTNDNDPTLPTISNYHIKTLMLWECEYKPQSWWSAESSLVKLCSSLLHKLSDWVADKHCRHYFISSCNLLDHFVDDASAVMCNSLRRLANESFLLWWFVEHYIRRCADYCPAKVAAFFEDTRSIDDLVRAVHAVVDWQVTIRAHNLYNELCKPELHILFSIQLYRIDSPWTPAIMKNLQYFDLDLRLRDYFIAVAGLQVACKISVHSLSEDLLETLWMLFVHHFVAVGDTATSTVDNRGLLSIKKAIKIARLSNVRSNALEMLHNEMSKAYLHQSLTYGQESTYCVVHVLLAAYYYMSGHYQSAIDHCKQALNQCDSEPYNLRCFGAEYLPQIDESVDAMFGLILLYQHVQREALKSITKLQSDTFCLQAFTTQLLVRYLYSRCSTVANTKGSGVKMYRQHLLQTESPLLSDFVLFKAVEKDLDECQETPEVREKTVDDGSNGSRSMDTSLLVTTLELVALEKLITVRQTMVREFHSEQFSVVNEFEVLYAYKCGLFAECMQMCRNGINMLLRGTAVRVQLYPTVIPEMLCLLDGELVSLFGVIHLIYPTLDIGFIELTEYLRIHIQTLLLYLIVCCHKHGCNDSIDNTVTLIRYVHDEMYPADDEDYFVDRLILKLAYRSLKLYIKSFSDLFSR